MPRPLLAIPLALAGLLIAYWTLLFLVQRSMLFPAPLVAGAPARPPDAQQIWLPGHAGPTEAWLLPPLRGGRARASLIIFAHGNGELIDYWPPVFDEARRAGVALLLVEYPGYGRSPGTPTQSSITQAVLAGFDWAATQPTIDPSRIIVEGRSLGGGAACQLALRRPVAALVLESTFTSVRAFARQFGTPGFLVRDPFDNLAAISHYHGPVLILHGGQDDVIPPEHGQRLAAAVPGADFQLMPCGHNDCPPSWPMVGPFLLRHGLVNQDLDSAAT